MDTGLKGAFVSPNRRKVYVEGDPPGIRVPFTEIALSDSPGRWGPVPNESVRLYDTSGPGGDPEVGLPLLRRDWVFGRGDVEEYEGRAVTPAMTDEPPRAASVVHRRMGHRSLGHRAMGPTRRGPR